MKKVLFVSLSLILMCSIKSRAASTVIDGGDNTSMYQYTISSTTVSTIATYSQTRKHLKCVNTGALAVYVSTALANTVSGGANTFYVTESTGTGPKAIFETDNRSAFFGIAAAGLGGSTKVYCAEER